MYFINIVLTLIRPDTYHFSAYIYGKTIGDVVQRDSRTHRRTTTQEKESRDERRQ